MVVPWQDNMKEALIKMDDLHVGRSGRLHVDAERVLRQKIMDMTKVKGEVSYIEGGGQDPLQIMVATENGWLVCVKLTPVDARELALLLLRAVSA